MKRVALRTHHGQYVRAHLPGGAKRGQLDQAIAIGPWEQFTVVEIEVPDPGPIPPPEVERPLNVKELEGDFLHLGEATGNWPSTLFLFGQEQRTRTDLIELAENSGHNCLVHYLYNEKDGAWDNSPIKRFNMYENQNHSLVIEEYARMRSKGIEPVPFLFPDDAPDLHGRGPSKHKRHPNWGKITRWTKELLPKLNLSFVILCLEMNESFTPEDMVRFGKHVRKYVGPNCVIIYHFTSGRISASPPRENKHKPKDEWEVPDPYNHSMPKWCEAVVSEVGYPLAMAYQFPKGLSDKELKEKIKESYVRVHQGRAGGFKKNKSTMPMIVGEAGKPKESNEKIRHYNELAQEVGVKGTIHSGTVR